MFLFRYFDTNHSITHIFVLYEYVIMHDVLILCLIRTLKNDKNSKIKLRCQNIYR